MSDVKLLFDFAV